MTIRHIDRSTARDLMDEVREELQALCERHGLAVSMKGGKYDDTFLEFKLQLAITGDDGLAQSREALDFERYASRHGLPLDALGQKFSHDGDVFTIIGYNRKATKYTIVTRRQSDEKRIRFTAHDVDVMLGEQIAIPAF